MLRYYLDTEFSDHGGWLISLGLVCADGRYLYLVRPEREINRASPPMTEWVDENVMPILFDLPEGKEATILPLEDWGSEISTFLGESADTAQIIADWPEDIRYLMELLITGPGESVPMAHQTHFTVIRHVDIYPTELAGAVQHNALWDALAIRHYVESSMADENS